MFNLLSSIFSQEVEWRRSSTSSEERTALHRNVFPEKTAGIEKKGYEVSREPVGYALKFHTEDCFIKNMDPSFLVYEK